MGWFRIIDNLRDAETVIERDKRIAAQYADLKQIRSQRNFIFLLIAIIIGYLVIQFLPTAGEIQHQKENQEHEKSIQDTVPNVDGIEI